MATLMHEGGADIRYIQQMLGHEDIKSTQIYTHVALRGLQEVHAATHPAEAMNYRASRSRRGATGTRQSPLRGLALEIESGTATTSEAGIPEVPPSFDSVSTLEPPSKIL